MERFVINALGECFRGDDSPVGSVDVTALKERLQIDRDPTPQEIDAEFDRLAQENLTGKEFSAWKTWNALQPVVSDLFRIYAGVEEDGVVRAHLSTEFIYFLSDRHYKPQIAEYAAKFGGTVEVLDEYAHTDKSCPSGALDAARARGEEPEWHYGPDHGRPQRQVAVNVPVWGKSLADVKKLKAEMLEEAQRCGLGELWVSVL